MTTFLAVLVSKRKVANEYCQFDSGLVNNDREKNELINIIIL